MPDDRSNPESTRRSRYERVKQILDNASGDAHPSYQGYDRFWNLPHAQFLQVTLYGIRMIAPSSGLSLVGAAPAKSCCHGPAEPAPAAAPQPGRGAASGLIKGLKGQAPFDGSQFPKLPWGGSPSRMTTSPSSNSGSTTAAPNTTRRRNRAPQRDPTGWRRCGAWRAATSRIRSIRVP